MLLSEGQLPLSLEQVARAAGVSKALIYAYFPTQPELINRLLERAFAALLAAGLLDAARRPDFQDVALACADLYFRHVAERGPVIHVILRDPYMAGAISPEVARTRDRLSRMLAGRARLALRLPAKEAVAALSILTTVPEEAGRMVFAGEMKPASGAELTAILIRSSLDALAPTA